MSKTKSVPCRRCSRTAGGYGGSNSTIFGAPLALRQSLSNAITGHEERFPVAVHGEAVREATERKMLALRQFGGFTGAAPDYGSQAAEDMGLPRIVIPGRKDAIGCPPSPSRAAAPS